MLMKKTEKSEAPIEPAVEQPDTNWAFSGKEESAQTQTDTLDMIDPVSWNALEFMDHEKGQNWYMALAGGTIVAAGIVYLLTDHDWIATAIIPVVAATFGFSASRKPRELTYTVDSAGVHIGEKLYPYDGFKSFSVVEQDDVQSIWLLPLKRFMPIIPIYFSPEDAPKIVDVLAAILPTENRQPDVVDKLMHHIRF